MRRALVLAVLLAWLSACGFGFADEAGGADASWWPWVCADGGMPAVDGGMDGGCE